VEPPDAPLEPGEIIIYDPRKREHFARVNSDFGRSPHDMQRQDAILSRVFRGRPYLRDGEECSYEPKEQREIKPFVSESVRGSFTAPHANETLYLIWNSECGASHADRWGTRTVAVLRGGKVVAEDGESGIDSIDGVFDLDGDGVEELVVSGGFMNQGFMQTPASVVHFVRGKLVTVASFDLAYAGSCAAIGEQREDFLVIHAHTKRGSPPRFTTQRVSRPCP
jgi:hypothetical protein